MEKNAKFGIIGTTLLITSGVAFYLFFLQRKKKTNTMNTQNQTSQTTTTNTNRPYPNPTAKTLGYKNNNPLNIRQSKKFTWQGEINHTGDPLTFCQFSSMPYGFRAGFRNIRTRVNDYGDNTIKKLINVWAPSGDGDNNPNSYAIHVGNITGYSTDQVINPYNEEMMKKIVYAMAYIENGGYPQWKDINEGWDLYIK